MYPKIYLIALYGGGGGGGGRGGGSLDISFATKGLLLNQIYT